MSPQFPSLDEIEQIGALDDAVIRNLQITQCYHELSDALMTALGTEANWCTFATWASRQAGQTIRKEDLRRLLERRLRAAPDTRQASQMLATASGHSPEPALIAGLAIETGAIANPLELSSQAVGRGNLKVFAEIGREFARFLATCLPDQSPDPDKLAAFCQALRAGEPPDGQRYLRQAFTHYYQARFTDDPKARAELMLLANLEIGFHEQTRLQPEIAESMDAGLTSSLQFTRRLLAALFPFGGWLALAGLYLHRLLGRPSRLDQAIQALLAAVRRELRVLITETMMTITLPGGRVLRLGEDLSGGYPTALQTLTLPELKTLYEAVDPHPDSLADSGALDWADLPDRLNFIAELFRCYQETPELFTPPYTSAQVTELKAGRLPGGVL
ncbi:MAG: hypothetical protein ACK2UW_05480 [Anaerolineales bacterium]